MKKKIFIFVGGGFILLIIALIMFYNSSFNNITYDIIVEEHRYEYEGVNTADIPVTGYATNYYYVVVNSEKLEKYTITYVDVWEIHNKKGDIDTVRIKKESINDDDLKNLMKKHNKLEKKQRLKNLLKKHIKEIYKVEYDK